MKIQVSGFLFLVSGLKASEGGTQDKWVNEE